MDTISNYVRTMDYLTDVDSYIPIYIYTYDALGNTLNKYSMDFYYVAKPISIGTFTFQ